MKTEWADLSEADLSEMIEGSSKRRHEVKDGRIRALYGISIAGKLKRTRATPPEVLLKEHSVQHRDLARDFDGFDERRRSARYTFPLPAMTATAGLMC